MGIGEITFFIHKALDKGMAVTAPGSYVAKKGKIEIILWHQSEWITIFYGKDKVFEVPYKYFSWADFQINKGVPYYRGKVLSKL